ncbi:MAG: 23S rRNA (uracil(1939)-C(5))-methyltransferase RlmD [Burkholderiaceae bacterium]|jgi:23S rRNA (uracil1939-C5)-methyltransferase
MSEAGLRIESLDQDARGIGHVAGKVVFVEQALPGETVRYRSFRRKASYEIASLVEVLHASAARVRAPCPSFGVCGGCSMQHMDAATQVAVKQRVLEDSLARIGKVEPEQIYRPVRGPSWRYRFRARLSVRFVAKRGGILIGFHERKSSFVADMKTCEIVPEHVSRLLVPLRALIEGLSIRDRLPQIELAVGEDCTVLVLRILDPVSVADRERLTSFATAHGIEFWLQSKGPETAHPLSATATPLYFSLPEFATRIPFRPTDFTQVNHFINRVLVGRAVRLLAPEPTDRIVDLFCGLGNFSIPLSRRAREVIGIDGSPGLVERARTNAAHNGAADRCSFQTRDLFTIVREDLDALGHIDKLLIDPPREGALAIAKALAEQGEHGPKRIVYVSCNPGTLARDAAILVHQAGYRLRGAGIVNMFPQTSHVESLAVFERLPTTPTQGPIPEPDPGAVGR